MEVERILSVTEPNQLGGVQIPLQVQALLQQLLAQVLVLHQVLHCMV